MAQDNRGGQASRGGKPGGDRRDGRPGGGQRGGRPGAGAERTKVETYETLRELTRGAGFRIDKFVVAEKGSHRPVKTEYRLTREGLPGTQTFGRLADAQTASTAPLPEPEPMSVEASAEEAPSAAETEEASEPAPDTAE